MDIAKTLQLRPSTTCREMAWGEQQGLVEKVRERMKQTLAKAPDIHEEIFTAPVEQLTKYAKGYDVRLKAFDQLAKGIGASRTETVNTSKSLSLSAVAGELAPLVEGPMVAESPRVLYSPTDVRDGDVIPEPPVE